jgi:hypothetical protein
MPRCSQRSRAVVALAMSFVLVFANRILAEGPDRIRPGSNVLKDAIAAALERSATFRSLAERIERSDLIVYLTCSRFDSVTLAGRTLLVSAQPGLRYVRVQVLCELPHSGLVAIVAHELQHVVEIASATDVVDDPSMVRLFSTIGFSRQQVPRPKQFETQAALEIGGRVRREMDQSPPASTLARRDSRERSTRKSGD